jgi:hypothetical protein
VSNGLLAGTIAHSPGPWRRAQYLGSQALSLTVVDAESNTIATIQGWAGEPDHHEANADLVASAPEMLAALIAAEEDLDEVPGKEDPPSLAAVRAVIAKLRRKT